MLPLLAKIERELSARSRKNLTRELIAPVGHDFSSNDYFCLAKNPQIINSVKLAADEHGYGSTSSRFIRGERDFFAAVESKFAEFKMCEQAILFQSGYAANLGALTSLIKRGDFVLTDQLNHASIIDGLALSNAHIKTFSHLDIDEIVRLIPTFPSQGNKFLVTESLFSMDGDVAPLDKYAQICREHNINLIVDEAHAVGLYGKNGAGLIDHFGVTDEVLLSVNGLGKAFGCFGAMACGRKLVIDYVIQNARTLMYSTGLPPLAVAAIAEALNIICDGKTLRARLFANVAFLENLLIEANLMAPRTFASPIFPIIVKDTRRATDLAQQLLAAGFFIKAIRPPTVPINSARLRITLNSAHTVDLLSNLTERLMGSL